MSFKCAFQFCDYDIPWCIILVRFHSGWNHRNMRRTELTFWTRKSVQNYISSVWCTTHYISDTGKKISERKLLFNTEKAKSQKQSLVYVVLQVSAALIIWKVVICNNLLQTTCPCFINNCKRKNILFGKKFWPLAIFLHIIITSAHTDNGELIDALKSVRRIYQVVVTHLRGHIHQRVGILILLNSKTLMLMPFYQSTYTHWANY